MSKHDFTPEEFADRLNRLRAAIAGAGLDWLLLLHPVSIRWLIGQDTKSYTSFQCLPVSAKPSERWPKNTSTLPPLSNCARYSFSACADARAAFTTGQSATRPRMTTGRPLARNSRQCSGPEISRAAIS